VCNPADRNYRGFWAAADQARSALQVLPQSGHAQFLAGSKLQEWLWNLVCKCGSTSNEVPGTDPCL
jgi:hypothetical protein